MTKAKANHANASHLINFYIIIELLRKDTAGFLQCSVRVRFDSHLQFKRVQQL